MWLRATDCVFSPFACYVSCAEHITQIACAFQCGELKTVACHVCNIVKYLPADCTNVPSGGENAGGGGGAGILLNIFTDRRRGVFVRFYFIFSYMYPVWMRVLSITVKLFPFNVAPSCVSMSVQRKKQKRIKTSKNVDEAQLQDLQLFLPSDAKRISNSHPVLIPRTQRWGGWRCKTFYNESQILNRLLLRMRMFKYI